MKPGQSSLFAPDISNPEGFVYEDGLISGQDERGLMAVFTGLPFKAYEFRGYEGRRRVIYFGLRYEADGRLGQGEEMPGFLEPLRAAAGGFAGLDPQAFVHALINEYSPGAPIGWHRDRPAFGDVVGVSFGSPGLMRFRRPKGQGWERVSHTLAPRSAYILRGPARSEWQHSLPPAPALRYSVTFRTLAQPAPTRF